MLSFLYVLGCRLDASMNTTLMTTMREVTLNVLQAASTAQQDEVLNNNNSLRSSGCLLFAMHCFKHFS